MSGCTFLAILRAKTSVMLQTYLMSSSTLSPTCKHIHSLLMLWYITKDEQQVQTDARCTPKRVVKLSMQNAVHQCTQTIRKLLMPTDMDQMGLGHQPSPDLTPPSITNPSAGASHTNSTHDKAPACLLPEVCTPGTAGAG